MESSITYKWHITKLECYPNSDKIITKVHWSFTATKDKHTATSYGDVDIDYDLKKEEFISYENLKEEDIIEWTKFYLEKYQPWNTEEKLIEMLGKNIEELELQELKEHPLPWVEPAPPIELEPEPEPPVEPEEEMQESI